MQVFLFIMTCLVTRKWFSVVKVPGNYLSSMITKNVKVGDRVAVTRTITLDEIQSFAMVTQDWNTIHQTNEENLPVIVHGAYLNGLVSAVMGTKLPGPGSVLAEQVLKFPSPCYAGDTVQVEVEIISARKIVECEFKCSVGEKVVLRGTAKLFIKKNFSPVV